MLRRLTSWRCIIIIIINSNTLGYWGGIVCALLVARICQGNPEKDPVQILKDFFATYAHWYAISMSCFEYITVGTVAVFLSLMSCRVVVLSHSRSQRPYTVACRYSV